MDGTQRERDDLEILLEEGRDGDLARFLTLLHPVDIADLIRNVDEEHWPRIFDNLPVDKASDLLTEVDGETRDRLTALLGPERLAPLVEEMDTDDAADVLQTLTPATMREVLEELPEEDAAEVQSLLTYPPDTAGGLMQKELVAIRDTATAQEAIEGLRAKAEEVENIHVVYLVSSNGRFRGMVSLHDLVLAHADTQVLQLVEPQPVVVSAEMDQEEVARYFQRYDLVELGVTDRAGRLLGRILVDDIVDVLQEEASEDILIMAGTDREELVYGNRVIKIAGVRLPWLITNLLGGLLTGYFLWLAKGIFAEVIALISFIPVITGMGGNVGTQSATIVTRGLATGRIDPNKLRSTLLKEVSVGIFMGVICGGALGILARLWQGNPFIGLVVGVALACAMTVAATMGVLAPWAFEKLKIDPAVAAGPFVTTANDISGILIYMAIASAMLSLMV